MLDENISLDGRKPDEIRQIECEIDHLPATHGSALFTRGETQSLTTVTLGTKLDEKIIDDVLNKGTEKFTLHYNFPPFATGEAKATWYRQKRNWPWKSCPQRFKNMMPPEMKILMQSESFPIFLNRTDHHPWRLYVQEHWLLWMPVLKYANLFRELQWDLLLTKKQRNMPFFQIYLVMKIIWGYGF